MKKQRDERKLVLNRETLKNLVSISGALPDSEYMCETGACYAGTCGRSWCYICPETL